MPRRTRLSLPAALVVIVLAAVPTTASYAGNAAPAPTAVLTTSAASPSTGDDSVKWLCAPGRTSNPCEIGMDTTDQRTGRVHTPDRKPPRQRPIDCFYVYPTVSNQLTPNATKAADPEVTSIARFQAARFSTQCRVFAPLYRQIPLAGLPAGIAFGDLPMGPARVAYSDVVHAWKTYLAKHNRGRGVVLIGHSQGSIMLRKLIHDHIDPRPQVRKRLVGAALLGGNVTTAKGRTTGGDFQSIPVCTQRGQAGCVVAYSTYASDPVVPFFGSSSFDLLSQLAGLRSGRGYEVACTDPARLSGITRPVGVTIPSERFAYGAIWLGITYSVLGQVPTADTTWVTSRDRYAGGCRTINGASVYRYDPTPGSRRPLEFPPTWGTHLFDVNLGLERLVSIVHQQRTTWLRRNR